MQSPERLRLLLILTVVDIRAVGPGIWTQWKAQLLRDLYEAAEEVLRLGHKQTGRKERIDAKQAALAAALDWTDERFARLSRRLPDAYWVAEPLEVLEANARLIDRADLADLSIETSVDGAQGTTTVSVYASDHPGLFYRVAGAISLAGANILDARIHTTRDGMALDNLVVQEPMGGPFDEPQRLARLKACIEDALSGKLRLADRLAARAAGAATRGGVQCRAERARRQSRVEPLYRGVEVNALDRPALLWALTYALFQAKVTIHSAHIATYGERAVDVFYLTDLTGQKIDGARLKALEKKLLAVAAAPGSREGRRGLS